MICENNHTFLDNQVKEIWDIGQCIQTCPICGTKSLALEENGPFDLNRKIKIKLTERE